MQNGIVIEKNKNRLPIDHKIFEYGNSGICSSKMILWCVCLSMNFVVFDSVAFILAGAHDYLIIYNFNCISI